MPKGVYDIPADIEQKIIEEFNKGRGKDGIALALKIKGAWVYAIMKKHNLRRSKEEAVSLQVKNKLINNKKRTTKWGDI